MTTPASAVPRVAPVLALAGVLVVAFLLRESPAGGHRSERPEAPAWLVDDPDAAYHLRRTQLALASGEVPRTDRFLNYPEGSPIPWPPFSDGLFAAWATAFATGDPGDPDDRAIGGFSEESIEAVLVHFPPVAGVLAALAVAFAAFVLTGVKTPAAGRLWAAVLAAWIYAVLPAAVWYGGVTRLDHHVVVAGLLALHLVFVSWSLGARALVDGALGAMLAGLAAGVALATWLASAVFVAIAGIALFLPVLRRDAERARDAVRAGLLYFATAAVTTAAPAASSAWNRAQPGSLVNLSEGVPRALAAAVVPFAVAGLLTRSKRRRVLAPVGAVAAAAAAVLLLPGFLDGVREGLDWASRDNLFMDVVGESRPLGSAAQVASKLSLVAFAFPIAWLLGLSSAWTRPERAHLLLLGACLAGMTLGQQRFGNSLAVPLACTLAVALHDGLARAASRRSRTLWATSMVAAAGLALFPSVDLLRGGTPAEDADLADWRAEVIGGLRWMRSGTPSPGPWNAPDHPQDWGVLSAWSLGHLIEYHARRPTLSTNFGSFVGADGFRDAAAALVETSPEELVRRMRRRGARYAVVMPRMVADLGSTMRIAGEDPASLFERPPGGPKVLGRRARESALWRLALHGEPSGSRHYPGFELVYRSRRTETPFERRPRPGEPSGPVISIYRLLEDGVREPGIGPAVPRDG